MHKLTAGRAFCVLPFWTCKVVIACQKSGLLQSIQNAIRDGRSD